MRRREFTPNDTRGVIRLLSLRYAGTARGRNRILLATVILCTVVLTMVFGITRGKIRAEELNAIRTAGTAASGIVEDGNVSQYAALKAAGYIRQAGRCVTVGAGGDRRDGVFDPVGGCGRLGENFFARPIRRCMETTRSRNRRSCCPGVR